jgi:FecR protein
MSERDDRYRHWAELMDREALGERLTDEERAFCARFAETDPACREEAALLDELSDLDTAPNAASRALVDATLARLEAESAKAERDQISRLRGVRAPRGLLAGSAAAALLLGVGFALYPRPEAAPPATAKDGPKARVELVFAAGEVLVDGKAVEGSSQLLAEGSRIEVARGAACVAMDPGIDLCLDGGSQVVLSRMQNAWRRIDLLRGKVGVQLLPQPEGSRLSIVADQVWSTAVGTAFTVERAESGVSTTVLHGKVRVGLERGDEELVSEHQRAQVQGGRAGLRGISRSDEAPEWALLRPAKLWSNPVSATLDVRDLPASAELLLDGQLLGRAPLRSLVPAGSHLLQVRIEGAVVVARPFACEAGQLTAFSFAGESFAPAAVPEPAAAEVGTPSTPRSATAARERAKLAESVAPAVTVAQLLGEARRLLRGERFVEAAESYRSLRANYPESPEAHAVLVSLAEVELDRLNQPERALENLERYLSAGRGPLMEEARQARIRALRDLGREAAEAAAIDEFLRAYPRSFKAAALANRLRELKAL